MAYRSIKIPRGPNEHAITVVCNTQGQAAATVAVTLGNTGLTSTISMTPERARLVAQALIDSAEISEIERAERTSSKKVAA